MPAASDSSEDENVDLFKESVDVSFFNDAMFKDLSKKKSDKSPVKPEQPKSQRYLANEEQQVDVRVSSNMQKIIGKKVSEIIENKIKFVDVKLRNEYTGEIEGGVKLFKDSVEFLTTDLPEEILITKDKRKKIKKRAIEGEQDGQLDREKMVSAVVMSPEQILNASDTTHWKSRKKPKVFKYKESKNKSVLNLIEDD